jgi:hypothetical protein
VGDNREKWGDFWEKSIAINRNIVWQPLWITILLTISKYQNYAAIRHRQETLMTWLKSYYIYIGMIKAMETPYK